MGEKDIKIVIAGGRDMTNKEFGFKNIDKILSRINPNRMEVVCGKARGADTVGENWAKLHDIPVKYFVPDWDKYGKRAGYLRNEQMAKYGTHLIAFWDKRSRGTKSMIELGEKYGLLSRVVFY